MNGIYALVFGTIMLLVAFVRALRSLVIVTLMKIGKSMKWFRPFGWLYKPISLPGYLILFVMLVFSFHIIIAAAVNASSVPEALYAAFPFVAPAFGAYLWIGSKSS